MPKNVQAHTSRLSFGRLPQIIDIPYLLRTQMDSYDSFLQAEVAPAERRHQGIEGVLKDVFPISSNHGNMILKYKDYYLAKPTFDEDECRRCSKTFSASLYARIKMEIRNSGKDGGIREVREGKPVYLGDIPMMTRNGSFIINGTERVIVSQLHRSPGVVFANDGGKTHSSGKLLYSARVIPNRGSWLDFEFDHLDHLHVRIDRRRKLPVTVLLRALGMNEAEILQAFFEYQRFIRIGPNKYSLQLIPERLEGQSLSFDIVDSSGNVLVEKNRRIRKSHIKSLRESKIEELEVDDEYLQGQVLARDIPDPETGQIIIAANTRIDGEILTKLIGLGIDEFDTIYTNDLDCGPFISETLRGDPSKGHEEALISIYRVMRPGNPPTMDEARQLFDNLFCNAERYDLSSVGRMKFNRRLDIGEDRQAMTLNREDIIEVIRKLVGLRNGQGEVDDIDHLGNRRVRSVGEMAENQFRMGLQRILRAVTERLNNSATDLDNLMPRDLISSKPVTGALQDFFGWSQLSQFMDQTNPLAEVTHKRRVSALGPGGLTRSRAGFEVRDVHPTHYGRLCPIETPEGPNIGLINSLALYARTNEFGFLETPYRKVVDNKVTEQVDFLSAINESEYCIAQASATLDDGGRFTEELVAVRQKNESSLTTPDKVEYMDVSPQQAVSAAASLVPFLEHDDANRALMGANMQRQAVPLLRPEAPLVGTGLEHVVARDAGACLTAMHGGVVESVNAKRIVIRVNEEEIEKGSPSVDIYNLVKYSRSNQNTCINQKPIVRVGQRLERGQPIADGAAVANGELALGQNMRIAFMPWNGYNYEDSILISEKVVCEERFTSVHIQELVCAARETKQGDEEITADIPHISEAARAKLDESGIIHIGAEVKGGDILVGRVTPKTESRQSPLEKLLLAVFGEKAADVKDTSLKVPSGVRGTVVDVQVFVRSQFDKQKDKRASSLQQEQLDQVNRDYEEEWSIVEEATYSRLKKLLLNKTAVGGAVKRNTVLTAKVLAGIKQREWFKLSFEDEVLNRQIEEIGKNLRLYQKQLTSRIHDRKNNIQSDDQLPDNVIKQVKVSIAVKRKVQPGDKMAGRHGNKGVISTVVPVEDMPFDEHGEPVDIVLNPLGVPSRMNVGQVLETHLGLAVDGIARKLDKMIREKEKTASVTAYLKQIHNIVNGSEVKPQAADLKLVQHSFELKSPVATPVFDGCTDSQIKELLSLADYSPTGQMALWDGRTGEKYDRPVTVGYMYMMKLNHLVADKMHARSTGPYSLITQQPLGGKAQFGGQRLGEMEVWALEAYGAAYTLREMLTAKSDDMTGRNQVYKDIVDGNYEQSVDLPESFNVLMREIRALGIDIQLERSSMRKYKDDFQSQEDF